MKEDQSLNHWLQIIEKKKKTCESSVSWMLTSNHLFYTLNWPGVRFSRTEQSFIPAVCQIWPKASGCISVKGCFVTSSVSEDDRF